MRNTTEIEKSLKDYPLIPMNEIEDEARLLAVRWVENYGTMGFDIPNKHKLASDIMNYAIRHHENQSNFEAFAIESIKENERTQIGDVDFTGKIHELKTWSEYFQKVKAGEKKFEVRRDDRDFKIGDRLLLKEFIPTGYNSVSPNEIKGEYTGDELTVVVTYILKVKPHEASLFGISSDTCVMSIECLHKSATDTPEELQEAETVEAYERYADATTDHLTRTQQERNELQEEVERLRAALEKISTMQLNSPTEAEGRFYDCIDIVERALNKK